MQTYPQRMAAGEVFAFEIENIYASRRSIRELLLTVAGVTNVRLAGRFGSSDDVRLRFTFRNHAYVVLEPFGDNSRYWIGPECADRLEQSAEQLEYAFREYRPNFARKVIGDVLTLRPFKGQRSRQGSPKC